MDSILSESIDPLGGGKKKTGVLLSDFFTVPVLGFFLIFFFQVVNSIQSVKPIYYLSKAGFPLIGVIFTMVFLAQTIFLKKRYPHVVGNFLIFMFLIFMGTVTSYLNFGQGFLDGIVSQFRLFPLLYFSGLYFFLMFFRPGIRELTLTFVVLGFGSILFYYAINFFLDPKDFFTGQKGFAAFNQVKGFRFKLPTVMGEIGMFYFFQRFLKRKKLLHLLIVVFFVAYFIFFHKQRLLLLAAIAVMGLGFMGRVNIDKKIVLSMVFLLAFYLLVTSIPYLQNMFITESGKQDPSFLIRVSTTSKVLDFFAQNPIQIFTGVGFLNPLKEPNFSTMYGSNFWLSDIGWLGVIFQYGILGSSLFAFYFYAILKFVNKFAHTEKNLIFFALRDWTLMYLFMSPVVPKILFQCGSFVSVLAIFVYYLGKEGTEKKVQPQKIVH